jgi:hypothetical protein
MKVNLKECLVIRKAGKAEGGKKQALTKYNLEAKKNI